MTSEFEFGEVGSLFLELLEVDESERKAVLALREVAPEVRAQVEALLAQHARGDDPLERGLDSSAVAGVLSRSVDETTPNLEIPGYRIEGVLGRGGMGVVYRARQERPNREVALKVVRSAAFGELLRRFEFEAEILGRLKHTGIAQIYEFGTFRDHDVGLPYFAMELVDGEPLAVYLRGRKVSTDRKILLVAAICEAVEHAHQRNVVHRDLKPDNILVTADGDPKILDFGIAKAVGQDVSGQTIMTGTGQIVGTMPYMSPEQVRGASGDVDTRSDVYSLGVILYESLCGELPLDVRQLSLVDAVRVICDETPPRITRFDTSLRGDIDIVASKALSKEPDRRYPSAGALAADLHRILRSEPIEARATSAFYTLGKFAKRHQVLVASASVILIVLIAALVLSLDQVRKTNRARTTLANERDESRMSAFLANITGSDLATDTGEFARAREMLGAIPPELRGWEWDHLSSRLAPVVARVGGGAVSPAVLCHENTAVAAVDADGALGVWSIESGDRLASFVCGPGLRLPAVSSDGRTVFAATLDHRVVAFELSTGDQQFVSEPLSDEILVLQADPKLPECVSVCRDGTVRRHSLRDGRLIGVRWFFRAGPRLGASLVRLGDVDGDGVGDYAIGAPGADAVEPRAGRVDIHSGANGALIHRLQGRRTSEAFGYSLDAGADHDGDGHVDLCVGAPFADDGGVNAGRIMIFSTSSWEVLRTVNGPSPGARLGGTVTSMADRDGDGRPEIVAASLERRPWLTVFGSSGGEPLLRQQGGRSLLDVGDVDGDGVPELAFLRKGVALLSTARREVIWSIEGKCRYAKGFIRSLGDFDGDGYPDLVARAQTAKKGQARVLSGRTGAPLHTLTTLPSATFVVDVTGDRDGDGVRDLVVSEGLQDGAAAGAMPGIHSSRDGRRLVGFDSPAAGRAYAQNVAAIGDVDGDGVGDALVAAPHLCDGRGWVGVHSGADGRLIRQHTVRSGDAPDPSSSPFRQGAPWMEGTGGLAIARDPRTGTLVATNGYAFYSRLHEGPMVQRSRSRRRAPWGSQMIDVHGDHLVAYNEQHRRLVVWRTNWLDELRIITPVKPIIAPPNASHTGRVLANHGDRITLTDTETGRTLQIPVEERVSSGIVTMSPDGRLVSVTSEGAVRVFETQAAGSRVLRHGHYVHDAAFSPDGALVATASWDNTIGVWDASSGERLASRESGWGKWSVAFSREGDRVLAWDDAVADTPPSAHVHDLPADTRGDLKLPETWLDPNDEMMQRFGVGERSRARRTAMERTGKNLRRRAAPQAALDPDRNELFVAQGSMVEIRDVDSGVLRRTLDSRGATLLCVTLSPDGSRVAAGDQEGMLYLWHRESGRLVARLEGHENYILRLRFSPDGRQIVTASGDGTARIWNSRNAVELRRLSRERRQARLSFAPIVEEALDVTGDRTAAAERIRARPDLSTDQRRGALRALLHRFSN